MNRSKIEWCDHTWNPVTGCRHGCRYCYAKKMTKRFAGDVRLNLMAKGDYSTVEAPDGSGPLYILDSPMLNETGHPLVYPFWFEPTLHRYRMHALDRLKMGNNIFVGAMADLFGTWVPEEWIQEIFEACKAYPIHNFLFLTKNPGRYCDLAEKGMLPDQFWYGYSATRQSDLWKVKHADDCPVRNLFVSIEPILEPLHPAFSSHCPADWVIIGAETGNAKGKVIPKKEWIDEIVEICEYSDIPVFMKESLVPIVGEENMRREFPESLRRSKISPKMQKKLYDSCAECKASMKKSDMITLLARSKRGEQPKQFGFLCKKCFGRLCNRLGLDAPELAELAESVSVGVGDADE